MCIYSIFISCLCHCLTNEGAANDLKGGLQQVLGDWCDPGNWQFLSVSIICTEDTDLLLTDFQHHRTAPVVVTCGQQCRGGDKHLFCKISILEEMFSPSPSSPVNYNFFKPLKMSNYENNWLILHGNTNVKNIYLYISNHNGFKKPILKWSLKCFIIQPVWDVKIHSCSWKKKGPLPAPSEQTARRGKVSFKQTLLLAAECILGHSLLLTYCV